MTASGIPKTLMRNDQKVEEATIEAIDASMGPQHHCCGMYGASGMTVGVSVLQWGRNITAAE